MRIARRRLSFLAAVAALTGALAAPLTTPAAVADDPTDPTYTARDLKNIVDAYGRVTQGQLGNPAYLAALVPEATAAGVRQLIRQAALPTRPAVTPAMLVPGWNVGNPLRAGWVGTRGRAREVTFTNRYGALLHGTVWAPKAGARDPYTGKRLEAPFPGVVLTEGSVGGSEGMYEWLAQDLAERGYVVLTYDVQGQGQSETLPHTSGQPVPFCDVFGTPADGEMTTCPGVPFQQLSNFVVGTDAALDFFVSRPGKPFAPAPGAEGETTRLNPFWKLADRSEIALVGHSMGARAVSYVQGVDRRVDTVVALDKLAGPGDGSGSDTGWATDVTPRVPALALQSEYGFTVQPWFLGGGSIPPSPSPTGPDPMRERLTGFEAWRDAGVDSMLIVPRASTHLEYTDIPLVLPASRWGQALSSAYVQRWLDVYLKHRGGKERLLATSMRYLEPRGNGVWKPVTLRRDLLLSFYFCSAYDLGEKRDLDITDVGC